MKNVFISFEFRSRYMYVYIYEKKWSTPYLVQVRVAVDRLVVHLYQLLKCGNHFARRGPRLTSRLAQLHYKTAFRQSTPSKAHTKHENGKKRTLAAVLTMRCTVHTDDW